MPPKNEQKEEERQKTNLSARSHVNLHNWVPSEDGGLWKQWLPSEDNGFRKHTIPWCQPNNQADFS